MIDLVTLRPVMLMSTGFGFSQPPQSVRPTTLEALALSQRLKNCLAPIQDPRVPRTRLHQLGDILTIAILAVMAGGNGWEDMEIYGVSKQAWASDVSGLTSWYSECGYLTPGCLSELTLSQFEHCFEQWVQQLVQELGIQVIAIDGKNLRGSYDGESGFKALHLVSAWVTEQRLVLQESKVQDKSNEITAIPALLELLDIKGCIVTLDPWALQLSIAAQIQQAQADYNSSLKANHPTLFQQVDTWFQAARAANTLPMPSEHKTEAGHHRRLHPLLLDAPARPITSLIPGRGMDGTACQLSWSSALVISGIKPPTNFSFTSAVYLPLVPKLLLLFVSTGASKIPSIGRLMSPLLIS